MAKLIDGTRIYGNATIDSNLVINGGYAANTTTTGSLQLLGGAGITGNIYVSNIFPSANNAGGIGLSTLSNQFFSNAYITNYYVANSITPFANGGAVLGTATAMFANTYASNVYIANVLVPNANAVTSFGTSTAMPLNDFAVNYNVANVILPIANTTASIGTAQRTFQNIYAVTFTGTSTTAKYADLAEMYHSDGYYAPGTVMVLGGDYDVTVSTQQHDTAVIGVVSTNPAYLMNDNFENDNWLPIALTGRVPCLVRGPVNKGTLLVSSDERGVACALDKSLYEPGCVIGKSMDIILDDSIVKIEIAVGRF